jgi:hypothetical protein
MRMSFDKSVPLHEQLKRIVKSHTGRKHQHRVGPGKVRKQVCAIQAKRLARYNRKVHAYWSGEAEEHP